MTITYDPIRKKLRRQRELKEHRAAEMQLSKTPRRAVGLLDGLATEVSLTFLPATYFGKYSYFVVKVKVENKDLLYYSFGYRESAERRFERLKKKYDLRENGERE